MELKKDDRDKVIEELTKKNSNLIKKNIELVEEIYDITSSRWYHLSYYLQNPILFIEKSFFKLFPYWLIPVPLRQKIRQLINLEKTKENDFYFRIDKILEEKKDYKGDIIVYSVIAWGYRFQRPQQLATQLRNHGYRIWYIKNEFIISSALTPNRFSKVYKVDDDIYEVILPSRSPLFIYTDELHERNASLMRSSLNLLTQAVKMKNIVQIIDHPFWVNLAEKLPFPTIYDCMDDHQSFQISDKEENYEKKLSSYADRIIVTSTYLKGKMIQYLPKLTLIRNGCDFEHFSDINITPNRLIARIKHPIVGYYGAIAEWFDVAMIEETVKNNPDWSFVFIGLVSDKSVLNLQKYRNVYFLGEQLYRNLPSFLVNIDVCIIPFKLTSLILATDPVKFYEMLAAGKPIVSVKIPEISQYKESILYTADKTHRLTSQIKKALKNNTKEAQEARKNVARKNTWTDRGIQLLKIVENIYPKVSIVIVTFNNWHLTENCLLSLEKDGYPNKEIIIVDNLSTDETRGKLAQLEKSKKIKVIYNPKNYGFAKANNIGLKKTSGQYLSLLNNDVEVTPFWIQKMIRHIKNNASVGVIGPVTNQSGNETKILIKGSKNRILKIGKKYADDHFDKIFDLRVLPAQCWFFKKSLIDKVGYLDERFGTGMFEDDDYCLRIKNLGLKVVCAEDVFLYHKGKASFNKFEDEDYIALFNKNKKLYEKKWKIRWQPHKHRRLKTL